MFSIRRTPRYIVRTLGLILIVSLLWSGRPFEMDIVAQLAPQIGLAMLAFGAVLGAVHRWTRRVGLEMAAAGLMSLLIAYFIYQSGKAAGDPIGVGGDLRIVSFNGRSGAPDVDYDAFTAWLLEQDADLVCVVEAPMRFLREGSWLEEEYPYRVRPDGTWRWPVVLLSRQPFESVKLAPTDTVVRHSFVRIKNMLVKLEDGRSLLFTAMHQPSPRTRVSWRLGKEFASRDAALLTSFRDSTGHPVIVAGDFNATPTGASYRLFRDMTGFRGSASMLGPQGSWPSSLPGRVALPIDHVWMSEEFKLIGARSGPDFGSDHRPIVVDVRLSVPQR